jgi:RimJ/RimL family protein N-acetyltransferase
MEEFPLLKGKNIVLRDIKESDIDGRFEMGKSAEFVYMCGGDRTDNIQYPPREVWERWYRKNLQHKGDEVSWIIEYTGKCIGSARLHQISNVDRRAIYAIGIWNESYMSRGIGVEATMLVLGYAFDVLKLHRVDLKVLDYNKRAINCYQKCGFKQEGILRDSAYIEGAFHSDIIMSILEDEYYSK